MSGEIQGKIQFSKRNLHAIPIITERPLHFKLIGLLCSMYIVCTYLPTYLTSQVLHSTQVLHSEVQYISISFMNTCVAEFYLILIEEQCTVG